MKQHKRSQNNVKADILRLIKAAKAVYDEDDAWTVDTTPRQVAERTARDEELGAALLPVLRRLLDKESI